jgi:hypothetical protein
LQVLTFQLSIGKSFLVKNNCFSVHMLEFGGCCSLLLRLLLSGSLDDCVEKDGTIYITKDATEMESSSAYFVQRTRH